MQNNTTVTPVKQQKMMLDCIKVIMCKGQCHLQVRKLIASGVHANHCFLKFHLVSHLSYPALHSSKNPQTDSRFSLLTVGLPFVVNEKCLILVYKDTTLL